MEKLNIEHIKTVEQFNATDFTKYMDTMHPNWIRHIYSSKAPAINLDIVSQKALDDICELSLKEGAKFQVFNSMGELFICKRVI